MAKKDKPDTIWNIPDSLWPTLEEILLEFYPPPKTGRPRAPFRPILDGIIYRLRGGVQWNKLPKEFGSDSTVHRWFQRFVRDGLFERLWEVLIEACDELGGVQWEWQSADAVLNKAQFWGDFIGKNPTDRGKNGVKRGLIVEQDGGPLGVIVAPANAHDSTLIEGIIESVVIDRPVEVDEHLCLDKAFDSEAVRETVKDAYYTPHIRGRGEEKKACDSKAGEKPRRWVVERTIGWLNRCRALLIRFDKKAENYLGLTQLACALLWWRRLSKLCNEPVLG